MKLRPLLYTAYMLSMVACATAPKSNDTSSTVIDPSKTGEMKLDIVAAKFTGGQSDYTFKGTSYKAQWTRCVVKPEAPFAVYFHGLAASPEGAAFCQDWHAQVLLKNGLNVIAVNRPGFPGSAGSDDLSGPQSVAASLAGIKSAAASGAVIGFWGVDTGVIAATFSAKNSQNLKWLMLGNGLYDLEVVERTTKSDSLKALIVKQRETEGDVALERRSIAWDNTGLPGLIGIYHAKNDDVAVKAQADAFNDQLRTAQTKVFFDEVAGVGHDMPWQAHYQIVEKTLKNFK